MSSLRAAGDRPPFEGLYIYAFTFLLGYIIADLTILKVRPDMLPSKAPPAYTPSPMSERQASRNDYDIVRDRNLFNADGMIPPAISAQQNEPGVVDDLASAALSQLPIKLEGTIVHANPNRSVASISGQGKSDAKAYMVEDEVERIAKIVKIERRKVIIRNLNNNRLEYIEIPKDSAISFGMKTQDTGTNSSEIVKQGEFDFSLRREDLNKYTSDLSSILNQARMVPNILPGSGGRVEGFRFVSIQPGSIYEKLGFKSNDVIKTVNGEAVNSPTKAMELYNVLRADSRIKLTVERDGREVSFSYDVKD
jgi:general secretion pathway protein C